jgi:hypothetical protein
MQVTGIVCTQENAASIIFSREHALLISGAIAKSELNVLLESVLSTDIARFQQALVECLGGVVYFD